MLMDDRLQRYITRHTMIRLNTWVVRLREHHIPQAFVVASGSLGVLLAWLFLYLPGKFTNAPQVAYLINAVPPLYWGMIFGAIGVCMLTCSWIDYSRAAIPAAIMALALFTFCALSSVDVLRGPATGLTVVFAFIAGWVSALTALLAVAPINDHIIRSGGPGASADDH